MMSGTSLDGVDAALIETDGVSARGSGRGDRAAAERALTAFHAEVAEALLAEAGMDRSAVTLVGFPGHTVRYAPAAGLTDQIGDGADLAERLRTGVVSDFRSSDVRAGGQGAPLVPLFHAALARRAGSPPRSPCSISAASPTSPGSAGGRRGPAGLRHRPRLRSDRRPCQAQDRDAFDPAPASGLPPADGAATLTAFTAEAVRRALGHMPARPERWLVSGGGRHNPALMTQLCARLGAPCDPVESVGWQGDALEAQAFGFLAVRSLRGLPLSVPLPTEGGGMG